MCADLGRAAWNREIVARGLFTEFWEWLARALEKTPKGQPLPQYPPAMETIDT
jgi:hypothetical protein